MATGFITADDGNGNVQTFSVSDYLVLFPTANIRTATSNFSFNWNGTTLSFQAGTNYVLTADQWAALQAISAPIS